MASSSKSIKTLETGVSVAFLFLSFCVNAQPASAAQINTLTQLIQSQSYEQAHELSKSLMQAFAGEPEFDFLVGQAAYYTQQYQEAIFAFERVIIHRPKHATARLLLAFSYVKAKNFGAAQKELNQLQQLKTLTLEQQAQIQTYQNLIDEIKRKRLVDTQFDVTLGLGYDSNASSGTEEDAIFFPALGDFVTITNGLEESDTLAEFGMNYRYEKKHSQNSGVRFSGGFQHLQHSDLSSLDRSLLNINAGYYNRFGNTQYSVSGYLQPMMLDDHFFRTAYGVVGELSGQLSAKTLWAISSTYARINNAEQDSFDMKRWGVSSRLTILSAHPQILSLSYYDDNSDKAIGEHNGKDTVSLAYSYLYPTSQHLNLGFHLSADIAKFDAPHPTFLEIREDDAYSASITTDYKMNRQWTLLTLLRHSKKHSNLALYDYDRSEVKVTLKHVF